MKMTRDQLIAHMSNLNITKEGINYVLSVYDRNCPSRKPTGKYLSVVDIISSRKMMWTQYSESRSAELPFLLAEEFSPDCFLIFSQPLPIKICYMNSRGKKAGQVKHLDFLAVERKSIYLVECKKVSWLDKAIAEKPHLFTKDSAGYHFPPAEESAHEIGLSFKLITDRVFTSQFTRNCIYLLNYIDELNVHDVNISQHIANVIRKSGNRSKLQDAAAAFGAANVIRAVFHQFLFVDLESELLCHPDLTWVYSDREHFEAAKQLRKDYQLVSVSHASQLITEASVWWDNVQLEVVNVSLSAPYTLHLRRPNNSIVTLNQSDIDNLIDRQDLYVQVLPTTPNSPQSILCSKKVYQINEAKQRLSALNDKSGSKDVSERTLYRAKAAVKNADDPLIALLSNKDKRGNRETRLQESTLETMEAFLARLREPAPSSVHYVWGKFKEECEKKGIPSCSYEAFNNHFKKPGVHAITLAQKGFKAAYSLGPQPREIDLDWDLPYHGDFIMEVAHVDHTPVEIALKSALTGEHLEGTLILSIMYDGHSRVILAVYISFEKPSYRLTMMLLRECYRRHGRIPLFICVDGGPDFQSIYFDLTIADIGSNKRNRPKGAFRHGSNIERSFGISESELIHTLEGNKQLQKLGRSLSSTHKPEKFATYTPDEFDLIFKNYAYNEYPTRNRKGISERPIDRWNRSKANFGEMPGVNVASEQLFNLVTLPDMGKDSDDLRMLRNNQLEFRGCNYLLSKRVPGYDGGKIFVRAKYNPYGLGHAIACIGEHWVTLSTNDVLVRECYDKGILLPHMEVFSRRSRNNRRYRQGSKASKQLLLASPNPEQQQFNLKQASIGIADPSTIFEPAHIETNFDINSIPKLSSIVCDGENRNGH